MSPPVARDAVRDAVPAAVRDAVPDDAPAIARVVVGTWREAYAGLVPDEVLAGLSVTDYEAQWRPRLPAAPPMCCLVTGSPVTGSPVTGSPVTGFVAAGPPISVPATDAQLYAIYVLPSSQGDGLGRALLTAAESRLAAAGFTTASLWVLTSNTRSRGFYEARGWTPTAQTQSEELHGVPLHETRYTRRL